MNDWMHVDIQAPQYNGHYLVIQKSDAHGARIYRWVRFYKNGVWEKANADMYGPVLYWMDLPPLPREV